jgi:two-component system alkaline phosphatase synthesis response regulator PhoP
MKLMRQPGDLNGTPKKGNLLLAAGNGFDELYDKLTEDGFDIKRVKKISEAFDILLSYRPRLVILDSSNNELSALEFCNSIKSINDLKECIVFILSDRKDELIEISSFTSGADDFVRLPLKINALIERIKARMKSPTRTITIVQNYEDSTPLKIDRESYSVSLGNDFIQLSKKEFELLYLMASHPEKLFRREEIFRLIWNKKTIGKNRTIDVHISRLRQKLGNRYITSQKGVGYRFLG